ncbi:hypothetical protein KBC99_00135 [Candidatus Saccharibacteria bacterium]|nr:hypothetical protein [Candidatus Saccharibacteria bacterium]
MTTPTPTPPKPVLPNQTPSPSTSSPADSQKKKMILIGIIAAGIIVLFGLVPAIILSLRGGSTTTPTPSGSTTATPKPTTDPAATSSLGPERVFIRSSKLTTDAYDITLSAPKAWDTRFTTTPSKNYPWEDSLLISTLLSRFSGLSSANPSTASTNFLSLMNINGWLNNGKTNGTISAGQKRTWLGTLNAITEANLETASTLTNPRRTSDPAGRIGITYLSTEDKKFTGIAYLTLSESNKYNPIAVIILSGTVSNQPLVLYGEHELRDATYQNIAQLQATNDSSYASVRDGAIANFRASKVGTDTQKIFEELTQTVRTFSLKPVSAQ